jgi:hypothetical protein
MPQTRLQVANSALIKIGAPPIYNFSQESAHATAVYQRISPVRDMMLRSHTWTAFRSITGTLTGTASNVASWAFYYSLPADFLRLLRVEVPGTHIHVDRYDLVGSRIYADVETLVLTYIRKPSDDSDTPGFVGPVIVESYPDDFAEAWACYLAAEIATTVFGTQDYRRRDWMEQYQMLLRQARFNGAVEQASTGLTADSWLDSRLTGLTDDRSRYNLDAPDAGL